MLLIDDLLLSPARGLLWIFREIHKVAREEMDNEPESIAQQLRNLYMQLETSNISEQQFEEREKVLLDRLDEIEGDSELSKDQGQTGGAETGVETSVGTSEETPAHAKTR